MSNRFVATLVLVAFAGVSASCRSLPWSGAKRETSIAFMMVRGQPQIDATLAGQRGRFVVGSAHPQTLTRRDISGPASLHLGATRVMRVSPRAAALESAADGIIGIDAWSQGGTLTVDYARGLVTSGRTTEFSGLEVIRFDSLPAMPVEIAGTRARTVIDTSYPGGVLLPEAMRALARSGRVDVSVGGLTRSVSALVAPVPEPRIGSEILQHFVVLIDYEQRRVALWRTPR